MSSYIQLPYGFRKKSEPIQFTLPKNYVETQYLNGIDYISDKDYPAVKNKLLDAVKNRKDLQKWILATSEFGQELQQDINEITGGDEKFNNAVVRRVLDLKNAGLFQNPEPINLVFNDVKKFDQQNPIIGKLAKQIKASKLTNEQITKNQFMKGEIAKIEDGLFNLKRRDNVKKDDGDDEPPPPPSGGSSAPPMREAEMDPAFRRSAAAPDETKKDYKKMFDEMYSRKEPPDPFSPDFWEDVFDDPFDTIKEKTDRDVTETRDDIYPGDLPSVPDDFLGREPHEKVPLIDTFSRPYTKMLDGETIEITPRAEITEEKQLSKQLQSLFPDIEKTLTDNKKADVKVDIDNLSQILTEIGNSEIVPFEFDFFNGGKNEKFREILVTFAPNTETIEFIDFLESDVCKKILMDNKLKIHIETGNIYYDNTYTNESLHNFILAQNNPISGEIEHSFTFDRDYVTYFEWLINAFSTSKKERLDIFTNKNSKFFFYHFNDYLQQCDEEIKKIKHSVVTQDYIAAEEIQDKNWQYFVESALSFADEPNEKQLQKSFQRDTYENVTILKKTYKELYNQIAKQLDNTLKKMPFKLYNEIEDDFRREKFNVAEANNLDNWVAFYYKHGRFPGNSELKILPQSQIPKLIDPLSVEVSPVELYNKFGSGDAKALVLFQAVVALFLHFGRERLLAKRAIDEWKSNLMFQSLSKESDKYTMSFEKIGQVVFYFLRAFLTLEDDYERSEQSKLELLEETINSSASADFNIEEAPEIIATSTPKRSPIARPSLPPSLRNTPKDISENESAYLKTALTMSKTN